MRRGAEIEECCDECSRDGVFDRRSGSEVRSLSFICLRAGREVCEFWEGGRDDGKDEKEVRRGMEEAELLE